MIRNRLSVLLAEKGLKITRVARDTGISRNTITSTAQNDTEMIRLETINTLCKYLGVTPCEFFEYEPLDIKFSYEILSMPFTIEHENDIRIIKYNELDADLLMDIVWGHKKKKIDLSCGLTSSFVFDEREVARNSADKIDINLAIEFDVEEDKKYFIDEVYSELNDSFYQDIYSNLIRVVTDGIFEKIKNDMDRYIKTNLDFSAFPYGVSDKVFADGLQNSILKNLKLIIDTDVFKPF